MLSTDVNVTISIIDMNDNPPVFEKGINDVIEVREDVLGGTVIGTLLATDRDSGEFGKLTYFLDEKSSTGGLFSINPLTGQLSIQV